MDESRTVTTLGNVFSVRAKGETGSIEQVPAGNGDGRTRMFIERKKLCEQILGRETQLFQIEFFAEGARVCLCVIACDDDYGDGGGSFRCLWFEDEGLDELEGDCRGCGVCGKGIAPGRRGGGDLVGYGGSGDDVEVCEHGGS